MILTLLLTIVLAVVVLSLASFATTGLMTSDVTTERTESNAVTSSSLTWAIDAFAEKRLRPDVDCAAPDTVIPGVPLEVALGGSTSITCSPQPEIGFHPTVLLKGTGTTADGTEREIEVVMQVPRADYTVQIRSWTAR